MKTVSFDLIGPIGQKATLGLVVLQADETLEQDFRRLFQDRDVALYVSRIPSGEELSTDSIAAMEAELPRGAWLLPRAARFDALGYGCTSGTTLIGAEAVARLVRRGVETPVVTDPLTAALAALAALGVGRLGLVTPYVEEIAAPVRDAFEAAGFPVAAAVTFGEEVEARVARIAPDSIRAAARAVAAAPGVEAVFLSCTNLRTLDLIDDLEAELGIPVLSSNQVLAWHMARSTGAPLAVDAPGRLFRV
ncbi:aspartate/glutamate racemase family protein [Albidovulum sediminicola]|uniref:Aspartate/glutamate racemase family protein n=1 Tax=Albidovulum sediminicola TaxID=2984331 RepID=A0ABT2Z1M6_9RHOB|nr:aspartate/glutamate racemase family protein [Defluviimonas sp. WL0075]MCV2865044.1 aspartate/glutamate racemase family protein [Defluviimonas sp. WL0075]